MIKEEYFMELHEDVVDSVSDTVSEMIKGLNIASDIQVWNPQKIGNKVKITVDVYLWETEK